MADSFINSIPFADFDNNPQVDSCRPIRLSPNIELGPSGDPYVKPISFAKICNAKPCVVFGNNDAFPVHPRCGASPKRDPPNINSLGAPVGLIHSSYKMSTAKLKIAELQPQRFATIMKTMAQIYIKPITEWKTETVDVVMREGQKLFMDSINDPAIDQMNSSIYNQFENTIRREFDYESMTFCIELDHKYDLNEHRAIHDSQGTSSSDIPLDELFETLKSFYFRDSIYGLLMLADWYLMIWRQQEIYFIADYYGRRITDFRSDRDNGFATVISLKSLENVIHLILNLSDLEKDTTFSLREMRLVRLTTPDGRTQTRDYLSRKNEYKVINDDYAYLKARLHLSLNPNDPPRNRSALPTAVAAIIAAKIDAPGTWTGKQLDKLMCYGLSFCRSCWTPCLDNVDPIHVEDFPRKLKLGQFVVKLSLHTRILNGKWYCVPCYKNSELSTAIEELFKAGYNKLIIQIDHQIYSVWSKNGFIYLFDPFRHRVQGDVDPNNIDEKSASLRVFRSLDLFLNVFNMILCEITPSSKFYIHSLKILKVSATDAQKEWVVTEYSKEMEDIMSLNEFICYEEDEKRCEELAEISDYGDDDQDVPSELLSISSSSTIGEDMEEEGEGGYGNITGVESSSSHEHIQQKDKQNSGSKHGDMETESFFSFDDKTSSHDTTRKESKNKRKRGKPPGDQAGNTLKESVDEPSGTSRKRQSSKMDTGNDLGEKKDNVPKSKDRKEDSKDSDRLEGAMKAVKASNNSYKQGDLKGDTKRKRKDEQNVEKKGDKYSDKVADQDSNKVQKDDGPTHTAAKTRSEEPHQEMKKNKDDRMNRGFIKAPEKKKSVTFQIVKKYKVKRRKSATELFIIKRNREIRQLKNHFERLNKKTGEENAQAKKLTNESKKYELTSKFIERYGEFFLDKNEKISKIKEDSPLQEVKKPKGQKGKRKKGVKKEAQVIYDFERSFAIEGSNKKKKIGQKQTVNELCCSVLRKKKCNKQNVETSIDKEHIQLASSRDGRYPGFNECPSELLEIQSRSSSYYSFFRSLRAAFQLTDRVLVKTTWQNFVVFSYFDKHKKVYYIYKGCTCDLDRFRHMDLSYGTAGLSRLSTMYDIITFIQFYEKPKRTAKKNLQQ